MPAHTGGPPKPSLAEKQSIATSNATVTTFLSGRQQKSWMTGRGTAPKPTSRPVLPRQPVSQAVQQQFTHNVLLSPAPSDEPSPAVSNPHDSPNPNPAALPGQAMANPVPSIPVTEARFVHDLAIDTSVPRTHENIPPAQSHLIPTSRPAPVLASLSTGVPQNLGPGALYVGSPVAQSIPFGSVNAGAPAGQGQVLRGSPTVVQNAPPPTKRRRTDPAQGIETCASLVSKIEAHIQACGERNLSSEVEKPRLQLLKEACLKEDVFFLALHQIFSLWSESAQNVQRFVPHNPVVLERAFSILESVLKKNQAVAAPTRTFFTHFPAHINQLSASAAGPTPYTIAISQVSAFLEKLSNKFPSLTNALLSRRYPYMVQELTDGLGCYSPVLQLIFFTACRRRLGVLDGQLGSRMETLFKQDQKRHSSEGSNSWTADDRLNWNTNLVREYRSIVAQTEQIAPQVPVAISSASPPAVQSPAGFQHMAPLQTLPSNGPLAHPPAASSYNPSGQISPTFAQPLAHAQSYGQLVSPSAASMSALPYQAQGLSMPQYSQQLQSPHGQAYASAAHPQFAHQQHLQQMRQTQQLLQLQQQIQQTQPNFGPTVASPSQQETSHFSPRLQQLAMPSRQPSTAGHRPTPINIPSTSIRTPQVLVNGGRVPTMAPQLQYQHPTQQTLHQINDRPLLPPKGVTIPRPEAPSDPHERKAVVMGLHQALARSPKRVMRDRKPERFYQAPKSLPVGPTLITPRNVLQRLHFEVTSEQLALASTVSQIDGELLPVAEHFDGSLRWRLRACKVPVPGKALGEHQWVMLDTSWPSNVYITCNNQALDIRRTQHNGKDLAIELTNLIVCGSNEIEISLPEQQRESAANRFFAVELLETLSHSEVVKLVWQRGIIPADHTLQTIKKRLTGPDDDDGVSFGDPALAIDLADPFSAVIFETPTRGAACTHMECFDLETWLTTRPSKPPQKCRHGDFPCECPSAPEPSIPDKWRCPICFEDARPYSLRIDGFLLQVRNELQQENKLQTKSMRVKSDGTWTVVVEADDEPGTDDEGPAVAKKPAAPPTIARRHDVEVIEID
ncbi:hypothetical protein B0T16DRAFT_108144 [Cercophora newfieldiana]|uniref:ZMIZ1/ZMIZ2 GBD-like domain-containing protein n=1 Tax=Cercophora newfieldiana TaxID=92897 RepID=A0AA39YHW7_9PEZI|nr:hypothetical protein B0T16DRAFT_108144 [Cercophora newfieldiana]